MGEIYGRKKYTNFFSYAKQTVIVLSTLNIRKRFSTSQFVKAFNALRKAREKGFNPLSDKQSTAANDSLRTLVEIGVIERIQPGVYQLIRIARDSRKFNKIYPFVKDPNKNRREKKGE